jgi:hypothetical protein
MPSTYILTTDVITLDADSDSSLSPPLPSMPLADDAPLFVPPAPPLAASTVPVHVV